MLYILFALIGVWGALNLFQGLANIVSKRGYGKGRKGSSPNESELDYVTGRYFSNYHRVTFGIILLMFVIAFFLGRFPSSG
jgi:hypothetical protein